MKAEKSYIKGKDVSKETLAYIKYNFTYDPASGLITRSDRKNSGGSYDKDGYLILKVKSRHFKAHRIAWFLYYGEYPVMEIDHINRDRTDNRISNLRLVTRAENIKNSRLTPNPKTGVIGVHLDYTKGLKKKYATRLNGKCHRFYSLEEAVKFRIQQGYAV